MTPPHRSSLPQSQAPAPETSAPAHSPGPRIPELARISISPMGTLSGVSDHLIRPLWSTDGRWLAAPCHGGTIAVWDMADLALGELSFFSIYARVVDSGEHGHATATPIRVPAIGFAFSAGSRIQYVPVDGDERASFVGEHDGDIIALASNHRYIASLGAGTVQIWDPIASVMLRKIAVFPVDRPGCRDLAWSAASNLIAVAGGGGVTVFDLHDPGTPTELPLDDTACSLTWSADGRRLAIGTLGGEIYLWQRDDEPGSRLLRAHLAAVSGVALSSDGALLASTSASGDVRLWSASDGHKRHEIPEELSALGHEPWTGIAFHPGANLLTTIDSYDQLTVRLWSVRVDTAQASAPARPSRRPRPHPRAPGHAGTVEGMGPRLATGSVRWHHVPPLRDDVPGPGALDHGDHGGGLRWQHLSPVVADEAQAPGPGGEPGSQPRSLRRRGRSASARAARGSIGPVDVDAAALGRHIAAAGLILPERIAMQTAAALNAGKHVLFLGPPGTGKTTLARTVADFAAASGLCGAPLCTAASADWTVRDTIGGMVPHSDHGLGFFPGVILRSMNTGRWLVIDAIDRADTERAFGDLLTVMAGHPVELPYQVAGAPLRILPRAGGQDPDARAGDPGAYAIHPNWRMLTTMNLAGQARPFPLSPVLMRYFAVVDVHPPDPELFRQLVDLWLDDADSALPGSVSDDLARALERLLAPDTPLMRRRPIAPAVVQDMIAYTVERARTAADSGTALLAEAFLLHGASQLEGLGRDDLLAIHRHLTSAVFPDTTASRLLGARMRALHPEIPTGAWSD